MSQKLKLCIMTILVFLHLLSVHCAEAKVVKNNAVIDRRLNMIDSHKFGLGLEASFMSNYGILQKFYYQYGSNNSIVNADIGVKLGYENPWMLSTKEYVSRIWIPVFAGVDLNCYRWQFNALYLGMEISYNLSASPRYHAPNLVNSLKDPELARDYFSMAGRLGVKYRYFDIRLYFVFDLKPKYNQKYIFESSAFDFGAVRNQIYERYQVGISFSYYFAL